MLHRIRYTKIWHVQSAHTKRNRVCMNLNIPLYIMHFCMVSTKYLVFWNMKNKVHLRIHLTKVKDSPMPHSTTNTLYSCWKLDPGLEGGSNRVRSACLFACKCQCEKPQLIYKHMRKGNQKNACTIINGAELVMLEC